MGGGADRLLPARHLLFAVPLDWWNVQTGLQMWPFALPTVVVVFPTIVLVRRRARPLTSAGLALLGLGLGLVAAGISAAFLSDALSVTEPGAVGSDTLTQNLMSGSVIVLFAILNGVTGLTFGWLIGLRRRAAP
jgi:hypothetical protein